VSIDSIPHTKNRILLKTSPFKLLQRVNDRFVLCKEAFSKFHDAFVTVCNAKRVELLKFRGRQRVNRLNKPVAQSVDALIEMVGSVGCPEENNKPIDAGDSNFINLSINQLMNLLYWCSSYVPRWCIKFIYETLHHISRPAKDKYWDMLENLYYNSRESEALELDIFAKPSAHCYVLHMGTFYINRTATDIYKIGCTRVDGRIAERIDELMRDKGYIDITIRSVAAVRGSERMERRLHGMGEKFDWPYVASGCTEIFSLGMEQITKICDEIANDYSAKLEEEKQAAGLTDKDMLEILREHLAKKK
jgi:hypothetical protein